MKSRRIMHRPRKIKRRSRQAEAAPLRTLDGVRQAVGYYYQTPRGDGTKPATKPPRCRRRMPMLRYRNSLLKRVLLEKGRERSHRAPAGTIKGHHLSSGHQIYAHPGPTQIRTLRTSRTAGLECGPASLTHLRSLRTLTPMHIQR